MSTIYTEYFCSLHCFIEVLLLQVYESWISIVSNAIKNDNLRLLSHHVVRKRYRVCENHFQRTDYFVVRDNERRLKKDSFPEIGSFVQAEIIVTAHGLKQEDNWCKSSVTFYR